MMLIIESMLMISTMFMLSTHPVTMSIIILSQTIMICLSSGLFCNNFWFSYMLFLTMISGLMILFMYMTNVASNEKFKKMKMIKTLSLITIILIMLNVFIDKFFYQMNFYYPNNMTLVMMKFYNYPSNNLLFMMMIYLLMTMIMTVKISEIKEGALRQKN
nr:NADH dehydrogenase subunit 6 [Aspidomorpha difformis]